MAISTKPKLPREPKPDKKWNVLAHPFVGPVVAALILGGLGIGSALLQRPRLQPHDGIADVTQKAHTYSFSIGGRTVSGESYAPFEKGDGYYARVEGCHRDGIEGIYTITSCYMTLKLQENLTIMNSPNNTLAIYNDGKPAVVCCMFVNDDFHAPLFIVKFPDGMISRRTYERNSEIHIQLNIPDGGLNHNIDSIKFTPGGGIAPVLFPINDRIKNKAFDTAFVNSHRGDPRFEKILSDSIKMKSELQEREKANRGFTYESSN